MKIAVVGASGKVGDTMMRVLEERDFPVDELIPVASERSAGKEVRFHGQSIPLITPGQALARMPEIALFSAGAAVSREWAPGFAGQGCFVIDNSSAWRMEDTIPLVVPEVNAAALHSGSRIIANPNCSTIQLVVALAPLQKRYGLRRVVVSTYQSVTGSGMKGIVQLQQERKGRTSERAYPHPIDLNLIPQGGSFLPSGYTTEEQKLVDESRKILGIPGLHLSATVVRVPVYGGHSESVNVELETDFNLDELRALLSASKGIVIQDIPGQSWYPMPLYAEGSDEVFIGRLRRDDSNPNSLNMWIVSDNLRKGAATNAVQIAEYLLENNLV